MNSASEDGKSHEARGGRRPTINDIARLANVSKKTVSRVINNSPFVRAETRKKIQEAIREQGYAPDPQARGLSLRRSFLIGLVFGNAEPQDVVATQLGLLDGLCGSGFDLVVHACDGGSATFLDDLRSFVERQRLRSVVLTPPVSEDQRVADLLRRLGCQYVRIGSVEHDDPENVLKTCDRLGARAAALHLVGLGHTRIGYICRPTGVVSTRERRGGFEEGLREHGLTLDPRLVFESADAFESAAAVGNAILAMTPRPTAIFADTDELAAGVVQAGHRAGLEMPRDLSVVGFGDGPTATQLRPPLTSVRIPTRQIARLAVLQLLGQPGDTGRDDEGPQPRLVERASSAPPAA